MLNAQLSVKVKNLCEEFSLSQTINQPTHYTEHSSSLIDIILRNNESHFIFSGVGDPFLNQETRYHCPIFGILNFSKSKSKSYLRHTWSYERGDYDLLRYKAETTDWESLYDPNINIYAQNITNHIIAISKVCIPNRMTRIRRHESSWINSMIKLYIRKRKRAYKKAKQTNSNAHWQKFKQLRNRVTKMIRDAKQSKTDKIANKLKSGNLRSRDWWSTVKSVISSTSNSSVPPLEKDGIIISDEQQKANALNDFFRDQTLIDDDNVELSEAPLYDVESYFDLLVITPDEVETP